MCENIDALADFLVTASAFMYVLESADVFVYICTRAELRCTRAELRCARAALRCTRAEFSGSVANMDQIVYAG
jgi:hypothetical protein